MKIVSILVHASCCLYRQALHKKPSVGDLMPPARGGTTEVESPSKVKIEEDVVTAATAAGRCERWQLLKPKKDFQERSEIKTRSTETPSLGATWIKFGQRNGGGVDWFR